MYIPAPIYEKLPIAYAAAGASTLALFGISAASFICSGMLLTAAGLVWGLRRAHRSERERAAQKRSRLRRRCATPTSF